MSTLSYQRIELWTPWVINTLNDQHVELSAHWVINTLSCQHIELSTHWVINTLSYHHIQLSGHWVINTLSYQLSASFLIFSQFYSCLTLSTHNLIFLPDEALWAKRRLFLLFLFFYVTNISVDFKRNSVYSSIIILQARFGAAASSSSERRPYGFEQLGLSQSFCHRIFPTCRSGTTWLCPFLL